MTAPTRPEPSVLIAGVPWPVYKVVALVLGTAVFILVGAVSMTVDMAVLAGAATAAVTWVGLGRLHADDD